MLYEANFILPLISESKVSIHDQKIKKGIYINRKFLIGIGGVAILSGCATMKESVVTGAVTGIAAGVIVGSASSVKDQGENAIKGALIGGLVGGAASYFIHSSLEKRDASVRKDTLMNLEHYEVMGFDTPEKDQVDRKAKDEKCFTTQEVDGRLVSIPCRYFGNGAVDNR